MNVPFIANDIYFRIIKKNAHEILYIEYIVLNVEGKKSTSYAFFSVYILRSFYDKILKTTDKLYDKLGKIFFFF